MIFDEEKLKRSLKQDETFNIYFLYGDESFLVKTYTDRIIKKYIAESNMDFNFVKFNGNLNLEQLSDCIDAPPIFTSFKVVVISNVDYDKMDNDSVKILTGLFERIPSSTILIISSSSVSLDDKKSKVKKVIAAAGKNGVISKFDYLKPSKIAGLIAKKTQKRGVLISRESAIRIAELTLCNLSLIGIEVDKLCDYVGFGGEITNEVINLLVAKHLDVGIYDLANAMTEGNRQKAFRLLDELNSEGHPPVVILSALSTAFIDYYRGYIGAEKGASQNDIAMAFDYPKNRTWVIGKAVSAGKRMGIKKIRNALKILSKSDLKLKSSPINNEIILERTLLEIMEGI